VASGLPEFLAEWLAVRPFGHWALGVINWLGDAHKEVHV
jgi:hypothetical protein